MTDDLDIPLQFRHEEQDGKGSFTAWDGDTRAALVAYSRLSPTELLVDHTETFPGYQGRGLGQRIVLHVFAWARSNNHKLMPLCPYTRTVFDRFPEWGDVRTRL